MKNALIEEFERKRRVFINLEQTRFRTSPNPISFLAANFSKARMLGATKEEINEARELRKRSITRFQVMEILECTLTELNRWDADGRLPHVYTAYRVIFKRVKVRLWDKKDVENVIPFLSYWRMLDELKVKVKFKDLH